MIKFTLRCAKDHRFDSWFQSADAFDTLKGAGMVTCAVCGTTSVEKAVMAPNVATARTRPTERPPEASEARALSGPASPAEQALRALKKQIEENSDYVGGNFARVARDMHDGLSPERPIYGEARADEARKLIEDGIPVLPLPFHIGRKNN